MASYVSDKTKDKLKAFEYNSKDMAEQNQTMETSGASSNDGIFSQIESQLDSKDSKLLLAAMKHMVQSMQSDLDKKFSEHEAVMLQNKSDIEVLPETAKQQEGTINELKAKVVENTKCQAKNSDISSIQKIVENEQIYARRKNLIFENVTESRTENDKAKIEHILKDSMKSEVTPKEVYRRGKARNDQKPRSVTVTFTSVQDKIKVLKKTSSLKNSGLNIRVNEDLPPKMLEEQRKLVPVMKEAKKHDPRARISRGTLIFKGTSYSVRQAYTLPFIREVGTKFINGKVYFHGRYSPLSNFFPSMFKIGEQTFPTGEHFYQFRKAKCYGADDIAESILKTVDPKDVKALGNKTSPPTHGSLPKQNARRKRVFTQSSVLIQF